ncbi:MAG: hypothetical protein K6G28_04015 [Acholeplasmatales bacterium]|nr:hypothetical protein [Acholeplasmatales bacterium]
MGYGYGASLIGGFITFIATGFNDCYSLCDKLATNGFNAGNPNYKLPNYEYNSFDDVLNNDETLKKRLSNSGSTISELYKMLRDSIGTKSFDDFYNSDKKVLCIGRDIKSSNYESQDPRDMRQYQNYASKKGFRAFYNNNFMEDVVLAKKFDLFSLANDIVVLYCCKNNWDFVLVTNPYYYMEEHLDLSNGGASYAN